MNSLPDSGMSRVLGFLEIVNDTPRPCDVDDIAAEYDLDLDEILPTVEAAELLGLVLVTEGEIELTSTGNKIIQSTIQERKKLLREKIAELELIKKFHSELKKQGGKMHKTKAIELLEKELFAKEAEKTFKKLVEWTRYAELFKYDANSKQLTINK